MSLGVVGKLGQVLLEPVPLLFAHREGTLHAVVQSGHGLHPLHGRHASGRSRSRVSTTLLRTTKWTPLWSKE